MASFTPLHQNLPSVSSSFVVAHFLHSFASLPPSFFPTSTASPKQVLKPNLLEGLRTLYFFTKSDFKTILLPVTVFASMMAPISSVNRLPQIIFWIWLHLLQFCVSNQSNNPEEDAVNKPWRPIPAGRVTVDQARTFRWYLLAFCLTLSAHCGVLPASIILCFATFAYNDLHMHEHMVMRNFCNAIGYASFELGATQLAGDLSIKPCTSIALAASALIVFTTIHAADFRDEKGDRLEGKKTLPIAHPEASRVSMLALLLTWSGLLGILWNINALCVAILLITGAFVGCRFMLRRDVNSDKKSYLLYNLWLSLAHVALGMGHYRAYPWQL